jgi:putative copper export protein
MSASDAATYAIHLLFAGVWSGTVVFVSYGVLPTALNGEIDAAPMQTITSKVSMLSRLSALALLVTGGHMAGTRYTTESLTGTSPGHLVLTMVALWLVLMGLVEVGASKLRSGLEKQKVRTPAQDARRIFQVASVVALLLLVNAGVLASGAI